MLARATEGPASHKAVACRIAMRAMHLPSPSTPDRQTLKCIRWMLVNQRNACIGRLTSANAEDICYRLGVDSSVSGRCSTRASRVLNTTTKFAGSGGLLTVT